MVAAAIVGAAVIGGVATYASSSNSASATKDATSSANAEQMWALQQQEQLSKPYRDLGESAIPQLKDLLGLGAGGADGELAALEKTPGYQFSQQQGNKGTVNAASSMGLALSGNTLQALDKFNSGLAQGTYQQAVGNLENTVNSGQAAAAGQAANIGNAAGNISNNLINQGNTLAGINANAAAGYAGSLTGAISNYQEYQTLQALQNQGNAGSGLPGSSTSPLADPQYGP